MRNTQINRGAFGAQFVKETRPLTADQSQMLEMAGGEGRISFRIRREKKEPQAFASAAAQRRIWSELVASARPLPRAKY